MLKRIQTFFFKNTTTRQTVIKNTFWLAVSNFGGRLIRAVIIIYGARILGASDWGVFSYGVTLAAFLTPFTDMGLSQFLIRETSRKDNPEHRATIFSTIFPIKLVLLFLGILIVLLLAPRFTTIESARVILPTIAFLLAFDTLREFGFSLIRAFERMEWEAGLFLFTNVVIVIAGFLFLRFSPTASSFTWGYTIGTIAGALATFVALFRFIPRNPFKHISLSLIKPIFSSAWPLSIAALLGLLMLNTDILIIGWLRSASDVGFYSATNRVVQLLYLIPGIIATSSFPTFSRLARNDNARMRSALERTLTVVFILALPLTAGGILLAPQIIQFLFGSEYLPGVPSFRILMLTLLIDFPVVIFSNAAFAYHRPKVLTVYAAIGGISNVILDFLLIPPFGIIGSAWATFLAQIFSNFYLRRELRRETHFRIFPHLSTACLATLAMAGVVLLLNSFGLPVILTITLGGLVYGALLLICREPALQEALHSFRTTIKP